MTVVVFNGQRTELHNSPGLTAVLAQGEAVIEVPGYYLIGPEQTVDTAMKLSQGEWDDIRSKPIFLKIWETMWKSEPPALLSKSSLGSRHTAGMIIMLIMAKCEGWNIHLQLPESYLHPVQCSRIVSMVNMVLGKSLK